MAALIWLILGLPPLLAVVSFVFRRRYWTIALPVLAAATLLGVGIALVSGVLATGPVSAASGWLRVD